MTIHFGPEADGFLARELEHEGSLLPYVVYRPPGFAKRARWPTILFLHGMQESGTDGMRQVTVGLPPHVRALPQDWPFVVVLPQKPAREMEWLQLEHACIEMLERAVGEDRADATRLHVSGISQGAHGALMLAAAHPTRFVTVSAACPYAMSPRGGWIAPPSTERWPAVELADHCGRIADALTHANVWLFHGTNDRVVPVEQSLALHAALRERNPDARLTLYPGVGHECWNAAYGLEGIGRWMLDAGD